MQRKKIPFFRSLSSQLLVLTILFVMAIEVVIYVPSIAQFRKNFLDQRLVAAQIAILAQEEASEEGVSPVLERQLLEVTEIQAVVVTTEDAREMILQSSLPETLSDTFDLRDPSLFELSVDAFMTFSRQGEGSIQIQGEPVNPRYQNIQVVLPEEPLYFSMVEFSKSLLWNSLIISFFTGGLIYLSLLFFLIRPTKRITKNLTRFSARPERKRNTLKASGKKNEIGLLEDQISSMQSEIQKALQQKKHLTNLGLAVSKINHDLKNILTTARLSVDHLASRKNQEGQEKVMARLLRSVDRAVNLSERTLKYGKAEEPPPDKKIFPLAGLVSEVQDALKDSAGDGLKWTVKVPKNMKVCADQEQLFRVVLNLCRNAGEAMEGQGTLIISARTLGEKQVIKVTDSGPGIPKNFQKNLFVPFGSSTKRGGTGLGLAIAQELIKAHKGKIVLEKSDDNGTVFSITLPKN